jgi:hypothetical protein
MVNILYVVRASPVKRSKGVQISLFTPILITLSSRFRTDVFSETSTLVKIQVG